jgi:hypothetical protein
VEASDTYAPCSKVSFTAFLPSFAKIGSFTCPTIDAEPSALIDDWPDELKPFHTEPMKKGQAVNGRK